MNRKKMKIAYDRESGVLSVKIGKGKSVESEIGGNVVIDYDKSGRIVRVNFYDFSFDSFRENSRLVKNFARRVGAAVYSR
jgi:uncharacterized protein YuzE